MNKDKLVKDLEWFPDNLKVTILVYDRDGTDLIVDVSRVSIIKTNDDDEYEILIVPEEYGDFREVEPELLKGVKE